MVRKRQSNPELEQHLREHLGFIEGSSRAYDEGADGEARRIAVSLRVLCHQTSTSHALLSQLGLFSRMKFMASGPKVDERNLLSQAPLTMVSMSVDGASHRPMLDAPIVRPRWVQFDKWWRGRVIRDGKGLEFSRKKLVLVVTNQDGGAHVDPALDEAYYRLSRQNSMNMHSLRSDAPSEPMSGPELATIRQIAHELYWSFARSNPRFL